MEKKIIECNECDTSYEDPEEIEEIEDFEEEWEDMSEEMKIEKIGLAPCPNCESGQLIIVPLNDWADGVEDENFVSHDEVEFLED